MSILSEQSIYSEAGAKALGVLRSRRERDPFQPALRPGEPTSPRYGGYTYAHDEVQRKLFHVLQPSRRLGPSDVDDPELGAGFTYAEDGDAYISDDFSTMLGQMAQIIAQNAGWAMGNHRSMKIAKLFEASRSLRSQRLVDTIPTNTIGEGNSIASGGPFAGYDSGNPYKISNWQGQIRSVDRGGDEEITVASSETLNTGLRNLPVTGVG